MTNNNESQELLRLFKCVVNTGTEVLSAFADGKCLSQYGGSFERFLDVKKHEIFHLCQPQKVLSCLCPPVGCILKQTGRMDIRIFKKLYNESGPEDKGHTIRKYGRLEQVCLHKYKPHNIKIHELDISAILFLLRNLTTLSPNEKTALETVTTYRDDISHAYSTKMFTMFELNTAWNEIENAFVELTDRHYKKLIRMQMKEARKIHLEEGLIVEFNARAQAAKLVSHDMSFPFYKNKRYIGAFEDRLKDVSISNTETIKDHITQLAKAAQHTMSETEKNSEISVKHGIEKLKESNATGFQIVGNQLDATRSDIKEVKEKQRNAQEDILRTIQNLMSFAKYERPTNLLVPEETCEDTMECPVLWQLDTPKHWNLETEDGILRFSSTTEVKFKRKGQGTVSMKFPIKHSVEKLVTTDDTYEEIRKKVNNLYKVPVSFGLELIIDRRLDDEYRRLIQRSINGLDTKHEETYQYMEEFIHMCELRNKYISTMESIIILTHSIRRAKDLRVRWLLSNVDFENLIGPVFEKMSEVKDMEMTKILAWFITKNLYNTHKNSFDRKKLRIWPGFRCLCKKKDVSFICSNQFEIIIESMKVIEDIPDEFAGFKVKQLPYEKESKESGIVTNCLSQHWNPEVCCDNIFIPGKDAESLFKNHSNLTLICSSIIKSVGMPYKHKIEKVKCVQLHCTVKGVIPIGENHFPASVCHYPTDVFEGCPLLATGLKVGDKVGTLDPTGNFKSHGTLGGFVNHFGYPCFLTCAHVVFDLETLLGLVSNDIDSNGIGVFTSMNTTNSPVQCGRVMRRVFEHSNIDKTSIDAALVHIIPNITVDSQEVIVDNFGFNRSMAQLGISSMDLNEICIDIASICHSEAELLCPGGFLKIKDKVKVTPPKDYVEIQFPPDGGPVQQGYAKPLMIATTAHMQLSNANLKGQRVFRMYNQLILNLPLQLGDSGTCIYVVDKNKQRGCLGMAIGIISSGQCIFTPLKEILKQLKH